MSATKAGKSLLEQFVLFHNNTSDKKIVKKDVQKQLASLVHKYESNKQKTVRAEKVLNFFKLYASVDKRKLKKLYGSPAISFQGLKDAIALKRSSELIESLCDVLNLRGLPMSVDLKLSDGSTVLRIFRFGNHTEIIFAVFSGCNKWVMRNPRHYSDIEYYAGGQQEFYRGKKFRKEEYCGVSLFQLREVAKTKKEISLLDELSNFFVKLCFSLANVTYDTQQEELFVVDLR